MKLVDTHCHLNFSNFKDDYQEIIVDCLKKEIAIVNIGADFNTSCRAVEIAQAYKNVYATIGLHPTEKEEFDENKYQELLNKSDKIIAIGEIGLDYFYGFDSQRKEIFIQQLKFARKNNLPVVLHVRGSRENSEDAYLDMLGILETQNFSCHSDVYSCHSSTIGNSGEFPEGFESSIKSGYDRSGNLNGVIHCFGSSLEIAQKFLDLGFYIGFTGIITFKNKSVDELKEVVKNVPLNKILIETDAPYLTPEPYRGQKNKPQYVEFVAKKIADIKNISYGVVAEATILNAKKLFRIF